MCILLAIAAAYVSDEFLDVIVYIGKCTVDWPTENNTYIHFAVYVNTIL
jgi:hypothetical protein